MGDPYETAQNLLERIDVISRLSPCIENDKEAAYTLHVLMDIVADHTARLKAAVDAMARGDL